MRASALISKPSKHGRGFTLVEVMIVAAIVAILFALALPSYRGFLLRTHRTDALAELLQAAACQERQRAAKGQYDKSQCLPATSSRYRFAYGASSLPDLYRIEAQPQNGQARDACGRLALDALGRRFAYGAGASAADCWSGR